MDSGIQGVICAYKEYRLQEDGKWHLYSKSNYETDAQAIDNMHQSNMYFTKLGGYMKEYYKHNRRFGLVVDKIVSVSFCGKVKKIFDFNYNSAVGGV